jgi:hypothetical protein
VIVIVDRLFVRAVKWSLRRAYREYLIASRHFRHIGAQTPSVAYGGSRSSVYMELLDRATTLTEVAAARARYQACHGNPQQLSDECGAVLRIVAYRLRGIPVLGARLERRVRADDAAMAQAAFAYPEDCERVSAPIDDIS